jgi:DNA-binding NarL/FixJ family response regulator
MPSTHKINVVIADSCPLLLVGIREVLAKDSSLHCVAATDDLDTLLRTLALRVPDVLVYDPAVEGGTDRGVVRDLHRWYPGMAILLFSSRYDETAVMQALRVGALGYLLKNAKPEELLEGVRSVAAGKRFISIKDAEGAFEVTEDGMPIREALLSAREATVLKQLGSGMTISDIANSLGLSVKTVSTYRARLCRKLDAQNTASLIRYALKTGLV